MNNKENIKSLYLDYQASTPTDERVLESMLPYFREYAGNPHSSEHSVGWRNSQSVSDASAAVATLIGAGKDEIIFTSGATEANNLALLGLGRGQNECDRHRFLISAIEHKCVLAVMRVLKEQFGYAVDILPVDKQGRVSVDTLEAALGKDVLAVSIMAVNNEIGTIQDIKKLSRVARYAGAIFHCDAAQAPLAMDLGGIAQHVDLLSLSAHKMYGPQGIGALYIRRDLKSQIEPLVHGGGQQDGLRSGTVPVPLCVGMGTAAKLLSGKLGEISRSKLCARRDYFVEKLSTLNRGISLNGPTQECRHPGNANVLFYGYSAQEILSVVQPRLAASTGSACTSGIPEPSHVLKAIGLSAEETESSIRFSVGLETSDDELDYAVGIIDSALKTLTF